MTKLHGVLISFIQISLHQPKNPKKSFALDKRDCRYLWFIFCYEEKIIIGSKQITFWHCHQLCFFAKSRSPKLIMHPPKERKKTSCFEVCEYFPHATIAYTLRNWFFHLVAVFNSARYYQHLRGNHKEETRRKNTSVACSEKSIRKTFVTSKFNNSLNNLLHGWK